ncbi:GNAT family N-acetyltransferase [Paenibacillus mendelii]|uniref:GNAT family N-acetyltransferase n=1 Tax=Paenibacillus mendelii TaxID=206163 RepID=A0ABV6JB33_9BACL|nr:GNAT family N-acetyltransferase [Paenibacillus mendelii]MCQ6562987.1 GNAT family N-acetyltransferase [Paenibacillus mendelii]
MIFYRELQLIDADRIRDIDRSELIERYYQMNEGVLQEIKAGHECDTWDSEQVEELIQRFKHQLEKGGKAYGAFDGELLVGFGVLANQFRGKDQDQLQVDLMYVSRNYRRQGIGRHIMDALSREAVDRGAKFLYISSTETESAVHFYRNCGSEITSEVDPELFQLEPHDIHMLKRL